MKEHYSALGKAGCGPSPYLLAVVLFLLLAGLTTVVAAATPMTAPPAFTSLELVQSRDQVAWTPVSGTLAAGFAMTLCPAIEFHYLDVANVATNNPLQNQYFGFFLDTTSLPADFYAYWATRGVVSGATGWQGYMWEVINGQEPLFFFKSQAGTYKLVDGLSYGYFGAENHLRVNGDYPPGAYHYSGVITDVNGIGSSVSVAIEFLVDAPAFEALSLRQSNDQVSWSPVQGDLQSGFILPLDPAQEFYYLDIAVASATHDLADGVYGFFLDASRVPDGFFAYWAGKGVVSGATDWQGYMWDIINGLQPMFYLKADAGSYSLLDGLLYGYVGTEDYLRVNGNYVAGVYYFSGSIQDECEVPADVEVVVTFTRHPELAIGKVPSAAIVEPGDLVSYTITVENSGNGDASGVVIADVVPTHTVFHSASSGGSQQNGVVTWEGLTLNAGADLEVVMTVTVDSPLDNGTLIVNDTYQVTCAQGVGAAGEPVAVTVESHPALAIAKTAGAAVVSPGDLLRYTITVENTGNANASGVVIADVVPTHTVFHSASSGGSQQNGVVTWEGLTLNADASLTVVMTVTVDNPLDNGTLIVNDTYQVTCTQGAGATGEPVAVTVESHPALAIAKTAGAAVVSPGDLLRYTITVENTGNANASGVVIADVVPTHTVFHSASSGGSQQNGVVTWEGLTLNAGADLEVVMTVTVDSPLDNGTLIVNDTYQVTCAQGVGATGEPVAVMVESHPALTIAKTAGVDFVSPGRLLTYTLVVENQGESKATEVVISDTVPEHTTYVRASHDGDLVGDHVQWTTSQINAGKRLTVTMTVAVTYPLTDGIQIVNEQYSVNCEQQVFARGEPVMVTVRLYHVALPMLMKAFTIIPPPPVCEDVIENGGFENGSQNPAPWEQSSAGGYGLIYPRPQLPVRSGNWAAWLGGYNNGHDELCQPIFIPEGRVSTIASWWWRMATYETNPTEVDTIVVEARSTTGVQTLGSLGNLDTTDVWLAGTAEIEATGQVTLCFVATTNASLITDFYLDDVAVELCVPGRQKALTAQLGHKRYR